MTYDVLMPSTGMKEVGERIAARARLHEPWRDSDPAAVLARIAPEIRAIVATHHQPRIDGAYMDQFPKLEIISSFGVGYDHILAADAAARGVIVTHTPGVLDAETADTAMALVLNAVRQYPQAERYMREGRWLKAPFPLTASLRGRTMGILGLGRIGREIAKRAEGFGLEIVYHGRKPQGSAPYLYYPSLIAMANACDILVIAAPGGESTRAIVNREILEALGPNGVLINIARGSLVDEAALIEALSSGKILAAGLDVFAQEPCAPEALMKLGNVVMTPHVGSASSVTRLAMANLVVDNLFAHMDGKSPIACVPETPWRER